MIKTIGLTVSMLCCASLAVPALADEVEFPAERPNAPIRRSYLNGQAVVIAPYHHLFPVRVFTTPQREPYYNVPSYPVISPH